MLGRKSDMEGRNNQEGKSEVEMKEKAYRIGFIPIEFTFCIQQCTDHLPYQALKAQYH